MWEASEIQATIKCEDYWNVNIKILYLVSHSKETISNILN